MRFFISTRWRSPKVIIGLFVAELAFTVPALALFAIADPDLYRTRLWTDGYANGFNSNPLEILYSYANHRPISPPLVWSEFVTSYNVVISVLSTFLLLVKAVLFIIHWWVPLLSAVVHAVLVGLWAWSTYAQTAPDMSDPLHPQRGAPWYITNSCSVAYYKSNVGYCRQAKAAFAVTLILLILFATNTVWAIWSMVPSKQQRLARRSEVDEEKDGQRREAAWSQDSFEMQELPKDVEATGGQSMRSAMTPRTTAFNRLEGNDLPLRAQQ